MNNIEYYKELYDYLSNFMLEGRKQKLEEIVGQRTKHLSVVLEDLFHEHNASAVIRTCECMGIQDVHIIENDNEYNINPDIVLGASKWLDLHRYNRTRDNSLECIKKLKSEGYQIVGTSLNEKSISLYDLDISKKTAIVFGREKRGISEIVKQEADVFIKIPMYGFTESFNISVSAGIALSYLKQKLLTDSDNWQLTEYEKIETLTKWAGLTVKQSEKLIEKFQQEKY